MRINIYAEELTDETAHVEKTALGEDLEFHTFHGFRMFLASPDVLHSGEADDDRNAITFFVSDSASALKLHDLCSEIQHMIEESGIVGSVD